MSLNQYLPIFDHRVLRSAFILTIIILLQSCTRAYRYFPSSHHIPAFTKKHQVSMQLGGRNQHLAFSVTDKFAVKGSFFQRNIGKDRGWDQLMVDNVLSRTGKYFDTELAFGRFWPENRYLREVYVGGGYGTTAYKIAPPGSGGYFGTVGNVYRFYSQNYSVFGQFTFSDEQDDWYGLYFTYKPKFVLLRNIHGENLDMSPEGIYEYPKGKSTDYNFYNQISATVRGLEFKPFYWQAQAGVSVPMRNWGNANWDSGTVVLNRWLWLEISIGVRFGKDNEQ